MIKFTSDFVVTFLDSMGNDLSVVNDARVSMGKHHAEFDEVKDTRLIKYLAKPRHSGIHWTPFSQVQIKLHMELPIFVLRQLQRSEVGRTFNEISGRYVETFDTFYIQEQYHKKPEESIKQGRGDAFGLGTNPFIVSKIERASYYAFQKYKILLHSGVCPEEARQVLPLNTMTQIRMTGSLIFWARVYRLRSASDAQLAINKLAAQIAECCRTVAPISWDALTA